MTQEHVLRDRQVGEQPRLLVDDRDAERAGLCRAVERDRLSVQDDLAGIRLVDPGEDLDERALAGTVLADQPVDLTGPELERDVVERLGRPEPHRDAGQRRARRDGDRFGDRHRSTHDAVSAVALSSSAPAMWTSIPRDRSVATVGCRRGVVGDDGRQVRQPAEGGERRAAPLRAVDDPDDLLGGIGHRSLDLRLLLCRVAQPRLQAEPGRPEECLLDIDLAEQAVPEWPHDREGLPADEAARHRDRDARDTGQLLGDPKPVRDDGEVDPAAALAKVPRDGERRRAGVEGDALTIDHHARGQPADTVLAVRTKSLPNLERALRPVAGRGDRTAVCPDQPALALEDLEVLADGHRGDAEPRGEVTDTGSAVFLDQPGDQLLAFGCEWGTGLGPGVHRRRPSLVGRCFDLFRHATLDDHRSQCQEGS